MSTPRKRWFKVADSILREEWDDWTLATVVRLMAWLNQRRARDGMDGEEVGEALINSVDAMAITRIQRPHMAAQRLAELPSVAALTSAEACLERSHGGLRVRFKWSKYSDFQRAASRNADAVRPKAGSSDSDTDTDTVDKKKKASPAAPSRVAKPLSSEAEALALELKAMVLHVQPSASVPQPIRPWTVEIDRMLRKQERHPDMVLKVIRWLRDENPKRNYPFTVLSAHALRTKFDNIVAAMSARTKPGGGNRRGDVIDAAQRIAEELGLRGAPSDDDEAFFDVSAERARQH